MSVTTEVQNLLGLFGITPEGAIVKLESTIATTQRQIEELDGKRAPLLDLLAASRRQLAYLRGEAPAAARPPKAAKAAAPAAPTASRASGGGEVLEAFDPQAVTPTRQVGLLPKGDVRVSVFAGEKAARSRLADLGRVGYHLTTARPIRPGQVAFTMNAKGFYLLVNPLGVQS